MAIRTTVQEGTRAKGRAWIANGIFVAYTHLVGILAIAFMHWTVPRIILTACSWFGSGIGITMGYHRLWSHRTFKARWPSRLVLAILGTLGFQGSIKWWSERHRLHHRFTDTEHDPYNARRGFWYSHIGWIFEKQYYPKLPSIDVADLLRDPIVKYQHRFYVPLAVLFGFILPTVLGWWICSDFWGGLLYGGHVSKVLSWHSTFSINSFAHWLGSQYYSLQFTAKGNLFLAILTNGEGHHNFHHEFPRDYRNGTRWYDYDPTKWMIKLCQFLGLAQELNVTPEVDIQRALIQTAEQKIEIAKRNFDWGPDLAKLPTTSWKEIEEETKSGRNLIVLDGFVYDVSAYINEHPGGSKLLKAYNGRDGTKAFHGGLNNHTQAARTKARSMIIAVLAN